MNRKLLTIGYTGYTLDGFTSALIDHGVECLLDIREIPLSRKTGFSKSALRNQLKSVGIDYCHFRLLGSPTALLDRGLASVYAGPDVWTPTRDRYPECFEADGPHPNELGKDVAYDRACPRSGYPLAPHFRPAGSNQD